MAYHRKNRRRSKGRHRGSKRLSKHMVRAIKAIALGPVETRTYYSQASFSAYLSGAGYVAPSSFAVIRSNFLNDIPRSSNTTTLQDESFEGNSLLVKGFRFEFDCYPTTAVAYPNTLFRFTVYSDSEYFPGVTGPSNIDRIFDPSQYRQPVVAKWNKQTTQVLYQRTFSLKQSSTDPQHLRRIMYKRMGIKAEAQTEESTVLNSFLGKLKRRQYYWVLEVNAINVADIASSIAGNISTIVYFKDP